MGMKESWERLFKFFSKVPPSQEYHAKWREVSGKYSDNIVTQAVEHCIEHNNIMPTIAQWIAVLDSIAFNEERKREVAARREEQAEARAFWAGQNMDNYGKQALRNIRELLAGKLIREQYLHNCEGMGLDMRPLRQYYQDHALELGKVAGE